MSCSRFLDLEAFADGEATEVQKSGIRVHLIRCRACSDHLADVLQLRMLESHYAGDVSLPSRVEPIRQLPRWAEWLPAALLLAGLAALVVFSL